jgi:endogenous inhibitor of DNA gyrase (YacG/DUF329 family)
MTDDAPTQAMLAESRAKEVDRRARRAPRKVNLIWLGFSASRIKEKTCSRCERTFFSLGQWAPFCSTRCQQNDRNERRREQRALARAERQRKRKPGKCAVCGAKLADQVRSTLRYCSNACRQEAYRHRSG